MDPLWYKNAILYELNVRSFCDRKGDGVGDFRGLTEKLPYLENLGVTALWLLPFYPSPLRDDGYDIADYRSVHPAYGTLADFKRFLKEAHARGLRVVTELVLNHTSDRHPWFEESRRAKPGSSKRDYYVWSDTPEKYRDARIIFKDFEASNWTWDPVAGAYFWHRFYSHQPDLNYANPRVHEEMLEIVDFWLSLGVDGLRLDAVPYLHEREGTNCENLPETHEFLRRLRRHVDETYGDRMLLAEANQWPEDAVAYFGSGRGDECHAAFHFPLMPRLFMGLRMEDRVPIVDILQETPPIPETSQWAIFLRNHDELTLEMVTDEERDYMYRVYAEDPRARINLGIRRRLAPLLGNDRRRMELMNALLFSLPGMPVLYYGDEIGMGENIFLGDRNGVRTPMQWSPDRNAGFSGANPQSLYLPVVVDPEYHYETVNVETQERNPHSFLWWMKRMIALRKRCRAFGEGSISFLAPENRKILAFLRQSGDETVLVVVNLSRFVQPVHLDLSAHAGRTPVELLGRTKFPTLGKEPYFLTLGPHAFYWFALEARTEDSSMAPRNAGGLVRLETERDWADLPEDSTIRTGIERALEAYLVHRRWFASKSKVIKAVRIQDWIPAGRATAAAFLLVRVEYVEGEAEVYSIPLAFASGEKGAKLLAEEPNRVVARLRLGAAQEEGVLHDAISSPEFCRSTLEALRGRRSWKGGKGSIDFSLTPGLRGRMEETAEIEPRARDLEQSNSTVVYSNRWILKLFRRVEPGLNPELDVGRFLASKKHSGTPALAGALEYATTRGEPATLGVVHEFVPEAKDAWAHTLDVLGRYFERVLSLPAGMRAVTKSPAPLSELVAGTIPEQVSELLGTYVETARLLGKRTAELHAALASEDEDPRFRPEPFTLHYQRSLYQNLRALTVRILGQLRASAPKLPEALRPLANEVGGFEEACLARFHLISGAKIDALRIRCHGDFHLGQVLYTGKDFLIIDFEGEPARSLGERTIKRPALRDVAGMLRSFHYASRTALEKEVELGKLDRSNLADAEPWARFWQSWAGALYLKAYFEAALDSRFLPKRREDTWLLLDTFTLEKALYEIGYELDNRPGWVHIPLEGVLRLLGK